MVPKGSQEDKVIFKSSYKKKVPPTVKKTIRTKLRFSWFPDSFRGRGGSGNVQEGPYMPGERFLEPGDQSKKK